MTTTKTTTTRRVAVGLHPGLHHRIRLPPEKRTGSASRDRGDSWAPAHIQSGERTNGRTTVQAEVTAAFEGRTAGDWLRKPFPSKLPQGFLQGFETNPRLWWGLNCKGLCIDECVCAQIYLYTYFCRRSHNPCDNYFRLQYLLLYFNRRRESRPSDAP